MSPLDLKTIRVYRQFRLVRKSSGNGFLLRGMRDVWQSKSFTAACNDRHARFDECSCGVYGVFNASSLSQDPDRVLTRCLAYGTVEIGTEGVRATNMTIETVFTKNNPQALSEVAKQYDVPLTLVERRERLPDLTPNYPEPDIVQDIRHKLHLTGSRFFRPDKPSLSDWDYFTDDLELVDILVQRGFRELKVKGQHLLGVFRHDDERVDIQFVNDLALKTRVQATIGEMHLHLPTKSRLVWKKIFREICGCADWCPVVEWEY